MNLASGIIKTERVYEVMSAVNRGNYVRSGYAYFDAPQQIGYGATISAPHMVCIFWIHIILLYYINKIYKLKLFSMHMHWKYLKKSYIMVQEH